MIAASPTRRALGTVCGNSIRALVPGYRAEASMRGKRLGKGALRREINVLQKVKRQTVTDSVIRQLIDLVASGAWPLGGKLPGELELARQLGVGRTSVREALKALQVLGVLTRGNDGTFVAHTLPIEMLDDLLRVRLPAVGIDAAYLYQARRILEGEIGWLAARMRTPSDLRDLEAIWKQMKILPAESVDEYLDLDMAFHRRLCAVVGNPILTKMWIIVFDALVDRREQVRRARQSRIATRHAATAPYVSIHEPLLHALRHGDANRAREVIHTVLLEMEQSIISNSVAEPAPGEQTSDDRDEPRGIEVKESLVGASGSQPARDA